MSSYCIKVEPDERTIIGNDNDFILDTAIRNGVKIKVGCKGGGCGICKIQILEGDVDRGHSARSVLPLNEIKQGYALACQTKPNTDVVINISK
ncbi:MAG: 2Fe-2S iron-sulfur cluster binding domain-containing protein [Bacillota bacterium]|nr:2Fe-2S iron-sulfur cluster binding domain-containing protein [Bacillota bacterium]